MKSHLIINFNRIGDILSTSPLINKIKKDDPTAEIALLVYQEFEETARLLPNVDQIHTVDRKKLETFSKSGLFNDFYAVDYLYETLSPLITSSWESAINISNDELSTRIISFLSENIENIGGIYFGDDQAIKAGNDWAIAYNDILPSRINSPLHFQDAYNGMAKGEGSQYLPEGLLTEKKYDEETVANFAKIRKTFGNENDVKLIGIQAKTSQKSKDVPFGTLVQFIQMLQNQETNWIPVILSAPTDKDREFIHRLNYKFQNKLISVEAEMKALPSIVKNLDALVTPDTAVKHVGDLMKTPTLEISLGGAPLFKQGSINPKSVVLTHRIDLRARKPERDRHLLMPEDIIQSLGYLLKDKAPHIEGGFTLYQPIYDDLGVRYVSVYGDINARVEAQRTIERSYLGKFLVGDAQTENLFPSFQRLYSDELQKWVEEEKAFIMDASKALLRTLRALGKAKDPNTSPEHMIKSLDQLIAYADSGRVGALPLMVFRFKVENYTGQDQEENMKFFEANLFELKAEMQSLITIFNDFERIVAKGKISRSNQERIRSREHTTTIEQ